MANESFANTLVVEVAGRALPADVKTLLIYAYVDDSRNLPDTFVLRFRDPDQVALGKGGFTVGAKIELKVQTAEPGGPQPLMSGEITAVGLDVDRTGTFTEVRGYDHAHRLFRGRRVAVYPNMTVSDIVRKVTQRAGIGVGTIDDVRGVGGRAHVQFSQDNVSDWEFLSRLADAVGAQIAVRDGKLNFQLPERPDGAPGESAKANTDPLVLELHRTLIALRAGITAGEQVPEVNVRGWDFESKQEITATATPKTAGMEVSGVDPVALAKKFGSPPMLAAMPRPTQGEAKAAADALAATLGSACVELDGVARGNPKLRAGTAVRLANVGDPFAGKYMLTSTRHLFSNESGYTTEFAVSGRQQRSLYGLAAGGGDQAAKVHGGLVPAIVSDARDPAKLGRLKLTFPWLDKDFTSNWARVAQPSAGKGRGALVLPEVGDEVLVGFEHGNFDAPYVLGGLHNGKDTVPAFAVEPVDGGTGEIAVRGFVSRKGHKMEFVEADGITIASGDGKLVIKLDQKNQMIEVTSGKGVSVKAQNGVTVDAGSGPLELKGQKVTVQSASDVAVEAKASMKLSGTSGVKVEGSTVSVAGQGQTELTASGTVTVRGGLVRIN
jgi:phage protein D/phage baseplate assembly protein gpV